MKLGSWSQRSLTKIIVSAAALLVLLLVNREIVRFNGDMLNRDFFSLWGGGRALLDGVDPYDRDAWAELHIALRQRLAGESHLHLPAADGHLSYPSLYSPFRLRQLCGSCSVR